MMGGVRGFQNRQRHWLVHWLVVGLLLPTLLGVLPQPVLSASAALDRDLALSICSHAGMVSPAGKEHRGPDHDTQCVLCALGCPVCAPADRLVVGEFSVPLLQGLTIPARKEDRQIPARAVLRDGSPPRGPPVA